MESLARSQPRNNKCFRVDEGNHPARDDDDWLPSENSASKLAPSPGARAVT